MTKELSIRIEHNNRDLDFAGEYVPGGKIHVVCLHGLQFNKSAFAPVLNLCSQKGLSCLALDFIGFGDSSKPLDFSYELEEQALVIGHLLKDFRFEKLVLVGHSMGGMIGTLLLAELEEKLLGFVNMEGNFVLNDCGASLLVSKTTFEEFSRNVFPELKQSPEASERKQWLDSTADYAFYGSSHSIVEWSQSEKLLPLFVESPVNKLFVYGEKNRRKVAELPASIAKAEIAQAGHFMLMDNPEETLTVLEGFLDAVLGK